MNKDEFLKVFDTKNPRDFVIDSSMPNHIFFERISLRGLDEMHQYSTNSKLYDHLGFEPFASIDETKQYLIKLINRVKDGNAVYWFIRRMSDNRLIGTAGLLRLDYSNQSVEWGFGIDPELWGNGYILQIMEALKSYVFNDLKLNRLYGTTFITNSRTIASLKATGMHHEGILREFSIKKNKFIDGWKYSMLRREYLSNDNDFEQKKNELTKDYPNSKKIIQKDKLLQFLIDELNFKELQMSDSMASVPKWDSLNHVNLMLSLEKKFKLKLTPIEITQCTSVTKIFSTLLSK